MKFEDLRVRFFCADLQSPEPKDSTVKQVNAFPLDVTWSWQKAVISRDDLAKLNVQTEIIADAVPREDLGEAIVELRNIRPAPRQGR